MSSSIRTVIFTILSVFFLLQGCSSDSGGGSGTLPPTDDNKSEKITRSGSFSIEFEKNIDILDYELSIKSSGIELTNSELAKYISHEKKGDGSVLVTLTQEDDKGLSTLKIGDVITIEAKGFSSQQFTVDEHMLKNSSNTIALNPIESRQVFKLADMIAGAEAVKPKSARGATTRVTDEGVVFETNSGGISLTIPKMTYERMARSISRLPRSGQNTEVYIDMTSVDPRTQHSSTIGDFSFLASGEPEAERSTSSTDDLETGLESVVMADMKMTTSDGDEIHCFDGTYDPLENKCSGDATAILKMQIPESQFQQYAQKYNDGDKIVPLYAYNKAKATWVRQLDKNGTALDSEMVLTDNNSNQIADEGDVLTIVGTVGHFSTWNGDFPLTSAALACLDVKVDLSLAPEASSYVQVDGVDYTGRIFKKYINADTTEVKGITAKANSIVSIELVMKDGSIGDSINYSVGARTQECYKVPDTLKAPNMNTHTVNVKVEDTDGNALNGAYVRSWGGYKRTDATGTVVFEYLYPKNTDLNKTVEASYSRDGFRSTSSATITQYISNVTIKLDRQTSEFTGRVLEIIDGNTKVALDAHVEFYNSGDYYYNKSTKTDENGTFKISLPKSFIEKDNDVSIYIKKYYRDHAYYPSSSNYGVALTNPNLGDFNLTFTSHSVSGQVSDYEGNAIASAVVYASGSTYRTTRSDENGNYSLEIYGDSDKNVTLQAFSHKEGLRYSNKEYFITKQNGKDSNKNLSIDLSKATIKGRILTEKGIALENMKVYWSKGSYSYTKTDENGSFSLETYNDGDGHISIYGWPHGYLNIGDDNARNKKVNGVELGKIRDLGNLLARGINFAPIIKAITIDPSTPTKDVPFTINIDAYDPDSDPITYDVKQYYTRTEANINQDPSKNIAEITADTTGYYYFNITVTDDNNNKVGKIISMYVKDHARPVITDVDFIYPNGKRYFDKTEDLNITVSANSIEGNTLSYSYKLESLNTENPDVNLTSTTLKEVISSSDSIKNGKYRLVVDVSDVYNTTSTRRYITIDDTVAPKIGTFAMKSGTDNNDTSINIKKNASVNFDVNLTNADKVDNPSWYWYINGNSSRKQEIEDITFANEGSYRGYVTVKDKVGRSDSRSFYVTVEEDAKPVITNVSITPTSIIKSGDKFTDAANNEVKDLTLSVTATDSDDAKLTYEFYKIGDISSVVTSEDGTFSENNATYKLSSALSVGRHAIKVVVSDKTTNVESFVNIEILKDSPPVITEFRVPLKAKVGSNVDLVAAATDPNGQTLTYEWTTTAGTIINKAEKNARLTIPSEVKDINVTFTVTDNTTPVSRTRTIKVFENQAPIISYFNLRTATVSFDKQTIELKSIYGDADGSINSAKYIVIDANATIVAEKEITQSDVVTTWTLSLEKEGTYKVYLQVTDNESKTAKSSESEFTVEKANATPTISSLTATSVNLLIAEETTLSVVASDVDGPVSISWSANGGSIVIASTQDKAMFSASSEGKYIITAIATDEGGLKATKTLEITVQSASLSISSEKSLYFLGSDVTLSAAMSSGHVLPSTTTWSLVSKPDNSSLSVTGKGASTTITPDVVGTYKVKADTTINGVAFSAEKSFTVQEESTSEADLEGTVTSDNGDILSGAKVRLYNKIDSSIYDAVVLTNAGGVYSFSDVPAGSYYLVVYAGNGYVSQTQVIEISK